MPSTAPAAPPAIYYQAADHTVRYSHNGHRVPDDAAVWGELARRGLVRPNGHARIVDHRAVMAEMVAAAVAAPVLPVCGPCGGVGRPPGGDPAAGREAPPVEQRCPDCTGSGRAPAVLTVGRVNLTPDGHPPSGDPESLAPAAPPVQAPAAGVEPPHHATTEHHDPTGRGMWWQTCARCPWRFPDVGRLGPDARRHGQRAANAHARDAYRAAVAAVEREPVTATPVGA